EIESKTLNAKAKVVEGFEKIRKRLAEREFELLSHIESISLAKEKQVRDEFQDTQDRADAVSSSSSSGSSSSSSSGSSSSSSSATSLSTSPLPVVMLDQKHARHIEPDTSIFCDVDVQPCLAAIQELGILHQSELDPLLCATDYAADPIALSLG